MGQSKAWLALDGETLLGHVAKVAQDSCEHVVVVGSPGQDLPRLPPGVRRVDDPEELAGRGPLVGAATGLDAVAGLDAELVFIGACDAAWLTARHIDFVFARLAAQPEAMAVVPESQDNGHRIVHATCGAVRLPFACGAARALLSAQRRALASLFEGLAARPIALDELPDPQVVQECNTPEQWHAARAAIAGAP